MNKELYTTGDNTTVYIKQLPMGEGWEFIEHSTSHYYDSVHVIGYNDTVVRINKMRVPIERLHMDDYRLAQLHEVHFFDKAMNRVGWVRDVTYKPTEHEGLSQIEKIEWRTAYEGDSK